MTPPTSTKGVKTMNENQGYNGYPNFETWVAALWIDNDRGSQEYWQERAQEAWDSAEYLHQFTHRDSAAFTLADMLKNEHEDNMPEIDGVYCDMLTHSLGRVDWNYIAFDMIDEVIANEQEDN